MGQVKKQLMAETMDDMGNIEAFERIEEMVKSGRIQNASD